MNSTPVRATEDGQEMDRVNAQAPRSLPGERLVALVRKEFRQLLRDRRNLSLGIILPIALIFIFGYGLSLDVKNAPIAVVLEDPSPAANEAISGLRSSSLFAAMMVPSMHEAIALMEKREVDGIVRLPSDFSSRQAAGTARVQLIVHGTDPARASLVQAYAGNALRQYLVRGADRAGSGSIPGNRDHSGAGSGANSSDDGSSSDDSRDDSSSSDSGSDGVPHGGSPSRSERGSGAGSTVDAGRGPQSGQVTLEYRVWFNEANTSTWYLVPGLIVLIMTLVGAFLTALVMAREWERGTLEALFVTPVRPVEILLAKIVPYFCVGMAGLLLCLLAARFLFQVPMRGSLALLLLGSVLYLLVALALGLLISAATKNQFLASQVALLATFLPSLMLSGFLFDLRNVPLAVRLIGNLLPATHYMELIKTLFLAGNVWSIVLKEGALLAGYAVALLALALVVTRKRLPG